MRLRCRLIDAAVLCGLICLAFGFLARDAAACSGRIVKAENPAADYNPFSPVDLQRRLRVSIQNSGGRDCVFALRVRPSAAGVVFDYRLRSDRGEILAAPDLDPKAAPLLLTRPLSPGQTGEASLVLSVPAGQMLSPGDYEHPVELILLGATDPAALGNAPPIETAELALSLAVADRLGVNIAGAGRRTTIDFGELRAGASRGVRLEMRSNRRFKLTVSSRNDGALRMAPPHDQARIPYAMSLDGRPVALPSEVGPFKATSLAGHSVGVRFTIGDVGHARAGLYTDEVAIEIEPAL